MKNFGLTKYLMLFVALVIISACSDSTTPSATTDYYSMSQGSWWVYAVTTTDSTNKPITYNDSVAVTGTETKENHLATILTTYSQGQTPSSQDYYTDGTKLYTLLSSLLPDPASSGLPIPSNLFPTGWAVIADNGATAEWTLMDVPLTAIKLTMPDVGEMTINGSVKATCKKGSTSSVTGAGKTFTAQEFIMTYSFDATITPTALPIALPLKFSIISHNFFADKVGLVKSVTDEATISLKNPLTGTDVFSQKIPATTSVISKYNIPTK